LQVTFNIDANGLLTVTAVDLATKKTQSVTITNSKGRWALALATHNVLTLDACACVFCAVWVPTAGRLTDAEIEKMIADAAKYKKADDKAKKRRVNKNHAAGACFDRAKRSVIAAADLVCDCRR